MASGLLIFNFFNDFLLSLQKSAYPSIWTECGKILLSILLKSEDKWSRKNLQLFQAKLLFLHIFTGYDTISPIYGVGKPTVFKKLILNKHLREVALVFTTSSQSSEEIESAGNKAMPITFNSVHHKQFIEKVLQPNSMLNRNLCLQLNQLQVPQFLNIFSDYTMEGGKQILCSRLALDSKIM